ncbi:MAG: GtrA family protein [Candidatus Parcubacteria bacterium]|nr:GtrA family protein [Candidatus Parcubacteria bacterium]
MTNDKIQMTKFLKHEIVRQFVKFCLVGVLNTLIDFGVYLFFSRWLGLYYLFANFISVIVAMTFSFFLNKYWTFQNSEKKIKSQYLKFALVNLVYFLLYNVIFFCLVNYLNVYDLGAKVAAIAIGLFWNFLANRYWTFKYFLKRKTFWF